MPKFYTQRRRIAVTGLRNTGKTVFITSLINHLEYFDPKRFDLGKLGIISGFQELTPKKGPVFDYASHRLRMGRDGTWPIKTKDGSRYACSFKLGGKWFSDFQLELRDFPGERFADVGMYGKTYEVWSNDLLNAWMADSDYITHVRPYLDLVEQESLDEDELVSEYKHALFRLVANYKPLISPSTFLLSRDGKQPSSSHKKEATTVQEFFVGIDEHSQFVPLTSDAIESDPDLADEFESRFKEYQKEVVYPLVESLRECDRMIVLLDIPMILQTGPGTLNDSLESLKYVQIAAQQSFLQEWGKLAMMAIPLPAGWRFGQITKVCFVAAKSDKVPPDERDNLVDLLRAMTLGSISRTNGIKFEHIHASAVRSTKGGQDPGSLVGRCMFDEEGRKRAPSDDEMEYSLEKEVPDDWPNTWKPNDYVFPDVYPKIPRPVFKPPKHSNLDEILRFLL